eukprot:c14221_g1_i1.p1 GENE.c14221_g1_i1~~c14221_g1_i1.p1  ORF type:complete len:499 (+),score=64.68 c14221_g1_i1:46-1497(+)
MATSHFSAEYEHDAFNSFPNPDSVHFLKVAFLESNPFPDPGTHQRKASRSSPTTSASHVLSLLPPELIEQHVIPLLDPVSVCALSMVSKAGRDVSSSDFVWRSLFKSRWPHHATNRIPLSWKSNYACVHKMETMWESTKLPTYHRSLAFDNGDVADDVGFFRTSLKDGVLASISSRGCVKLWDLDTLSQRLVIVEPQPSDTDSPVRLAVNNGRIVVGTPSGKVSLYRVRDGSLIGSLDFSRFGAHINLESKKLFGIFFTENGDLLTCHGSHDVFCWDPETLSPLKYYSFVLGRSRCSAAVPLMGCDDEVYYIASTPSLILSTHNSGSIHAWHQGTGQLCRSFLGHAETCTRLCVVSGPQPKMISSSFDGTVRLWDLTTGVCHDVYNAGCAVVGLAAGDCRPEYVVILTLDPQTATRCTGLQILKICDNKLKCVRTIQRKSSRPISTNMCCFFDGLRVLYTHEPSTDRVGGEVEVVSLEFASDV